jgi:hypothetical protein
MSSWGSFVPSPGLWRWSVQKLPAAIRLRAHSLYFWSLVVVFFTMAALSILRWPENTHLFVLGILSFSAGVVGRMARQRSWPGWLPVHVTGMTVSYIVLLTAFYVDNGPHLPLWRSLPPLTDWLLPSLVGVPILVWTLKRHPLVRHSRSRHPSA